MKIVHRLFAIFVIFSFFSFFLTLTTQNLCNSSKDYSRKYVYCWCWIELSGIDIESANSARLFESYIQMGISQFRNNLYEKSHKSFQNAAISLKLKHIGSNNFIMLLHNDHVTRDFEIIKENKFETLELNEIWVRSFLSVYDTHPSRVNLVKVIRPNEG